MNSASPEHVEGLVNYPAIAPPETQSRIDRFLDSCQSVRDCHRDDQRRARIALASAQAAHLTARYQELEQLLHDGDLWLAEHPEDIADHEDGWLEADAEYRAIWDAFREGLHVAFGTPVAPEQARMLGVG